MAEQEILEVAGLRTPVLTAGRQDAGDAAVFVHGNPGSSLDWEDLAARVGEFGRAVAPDMPGFGRAAKPDDFDYTVDGYARHLRAVLDRLGVRRAHLVLHDFGGPWGLEWASHHPERLGSLTLINTGFLFDYTWHYLARIWRTPVVGELFLATTTYAAFRFSLMHGNPRGLPRPFVRRMYRDMDRGTKRAVLRLYRATGDPHGMAMRQAERLQGRDAPVLIVWGKHDPSLPLGLAERQKEVFPDAHVVVLEDSGHWCFADDPEGVARHVVPFLRVQLATPAVG